jgi:DNA invertase Pin-like site-specific DNA recombinase
MNPTDQETMRHRAAAYVRMSTEHQQYSTCNQMEAIQGFARQRNLEVVKQYSDEGKSGLNIKGRAALSQMIGDVLAKNADFGHILVYDVSRWGRFQDPDEAAHYEFICREAGVTVHYCAEPFENDGGLTSVIAKSFKRAMAGEFSRELSAKVFRGACTMIRMGFKQGGSAVFGLRRLLVDQDGRPKVVLQAGEQKHLQTDRVILIPGPEAEVKAVRWVFETFVNKRTGARLIARLLNEQGIPSPSGRPWTELKVRDLLHNEKYIGNLVYARRSCKLRRRNVPNPPELWIRREQAFEGIVPRELFFKAQDRFASNELRHRHPEAEMLDKLRALLQKHGHLTSDLIDEAKGVPQSNTYRKRFGSLVAAYRRIGFETHRTYQPEVTGRLGKINREMVGVIIRRIESLGASATWDQHHRILLVNQELRVWIIFIRHNVTPFGTPSWLIHRRVRVKPDIVMAVRMDRNNAGIQDYYLLPGMENPRMRMCLGEHNGVYLDAYRFPTPDFLVGMAARVKLSEAR